MLGFFSRAPSSKKMWWSAFVIRNVATMRKVIAGVSKDFNTLRVIVLSKIQSIIYLRGRV